MGFVGKLALFKASIGVGGVVGSAALIALIFAGSALSFLYSFQVYQRAYLRPERAERGKPSPTAARALAITLAALVILAGLYPEPLLVIGEGAAAVLTGGPR